MSEFWRYDLTCVKCGVVLRHAVRMTPGRQTQLAREQGWSVRGEGFVCPDCSSGDSTWSGAS